MTTKRVFWGILILFILMLGYVLSQAGEVGYLKAVVAAAGLVLVGWSWSRGKGVSQAATEDMTTNTTPHSPHSQPPKSTSQKPQMPPMRERAVFLYRKPRSDGDITIDGTSWLGGLPALGDAVWPKDSLGDLMHHVMQIDLSDAAGAFLNVPGLPTTGSLAVFTALGETDATLESAVRYVAHPAGETQPPGQLGAIHDHTTGGHVRIGEDPAKLTTLPRWAVDLVRLEVDPNADSLRDQLDALAPLGTGMDVSAHTFRELLPMAINPATGTVHTCLRGPSRWQWRGMVEPLHFKAWPTESRLSLANSKRKGFPSTQTLTACARIWQNIRVSCAASAS